MTRYRLLASLLLLAACATPAERCIRDATKDLRVVNRLIAETELTIARGYSVRREAVVRPRLTFCAGHRHSNVGLRFCSDPYVTYRDRPVAVDLAAEEAKLTSLRRKRAELEVQARRGIAACEAGI